MAFQFLSKSLLSQSLWPYTLLPYALICGLLLDSGLAQAQTNEFAQQIRSQLDTLGESLRTDGYHSILTHIDEVGLSSGESKTWELPLEAGTEYVITAVCDNDCQNVDLELLEGNRIVDVDRAEDAYPTIVGITGEYEYKVKVIMQSCTISPCYSGIRVFQQE